MISFKPTTVISLTPEVITPSTTLTGGSFIAAKNLDVILEPSDQIAILLVHLKQQIIAYLDEINEGKITNEQFIKIMRFADSILQDTGHSGDPVQDASEVYAALEAISLLKTSSDTQAQMLINGVLALGQNLFPNHAINWDSFLSAVQDLDQKRLKKRAISSLIS